MSSFGLFFVSRPDIGAAVEASRLGQRAGPCISYCRRSGATVQVALARTVGDWGT